MILAFFAHEMPGGREICEGRPDLRGGFGGLRVDDGGDFEGEVLKDGEFVVVRENGPGKFVAFADEGIKLLGTVEIGESCAGFVPP